MTARGGASLARHNAVLLAAVFIVFELLVATAVVAFVMAPMARRSADDLAGLMVLSAQTWNELPPETRADFELELARSHLLTLSAQAPNGSDDEWHGPYLHFIEAALASKTRRPQHLVRESRNGEDWFWSTLPSGSSNIAVGFPARRVGTQPLRTLLVTAGGALLLALLTAVWLARRTVGPLARLEKAVADVGRGAAPELLPETGPRELAALASRFNQMARQVDELLAARTTLLAGVSHDLRTPLSRMRLALALLAEQPTPALISRMEKDIEEMDRLIGKVLDLARGLEHEAPAAIDLAALLADLAGDTTTGAVSIVLPAAPLNLVAARTALRRVLGNLLDNAVRYGNGQPIELIATAKAGDDAIRIGVLDRGPGIPAEQMDAVFQPFHRVEASRSAVTGGSGLGLAIVRQLAAANGWRVTLHNREGGGLEAWLALPTT